jgi:hypothetical protein
MLFAAMVVLSVNMELSKIRDFFYFIRFIIGYLAIKKLLHYIRKMFCSFYTEPLQQYYQVA